MGDLRDNSPVKEQDIALSSETRGTTNQLEISGESPTGAELHRTSTGQETTAATTAQRQLQAYTRYPPS